MKKATPGRRDLCVSSALAGSQGIQRGGSAGSAGNEPSVALNQLVVPPMKDAIPKYEPGFI